jgi:Protein of unknown function (DUF3309)
MKGTPAALEGSLTSKPTWWNTSGCSATSAFFFDLDPFFRTRLCRKGAFMGLLLLIVLLLLLFGGLPTWGYSRSWGYGPSGGLGLLLIIVLVLVLFTDVIHITRF